MILLNEYLQVKKMKRIPVGLTLLIILSLAFSAFSVQADSHLQEQDATPTPVFGEGLQEQAEGLDDAIGDDVFARDPAMRGQAARISDIPGFAVFDLDGEEVGRVHSVLLDETGHVAYLVLSADYQLQTDNQFVPVPWGAVDLLGRQQVAERFGNDFDLETEPAETPIVPTPELPAPTPVQPGDVATPVAPVDPDEDENDNDADATPEPGQTGQLPVQPGQDPALPSQLTDDHLAQQTGVDHWDRQFALILNVDRQILQDAPSFDYVLTENWGANWESDLYNYWSEHLAIIPETGENGDVELVQILDVRGKQVQDQDGEEIGRVFEVIMRQPANQVAYVIVETGGNFGFDVERVAVPFEQLEMEVREGRNILILRADRQTFDEAPRLQTEGDVQQLYTPGADQQIREHWGTVMDVDVTPVAPDPTRSLQTRLRSLQTRPRLLLEMIRHL
jgi:sporulation protein YlmC with PRC-barrel domain